MDWPLEAQRGVVDGVFSLFGDLGHEICVRTSLLILPFRKILFIIFSCIINTWSHGYSARRLSLNMKNLTLMSQVTALKSEDAFAELYYSQSPSRFL